MSQSPSSRTYSRRWPSLDQVGSATAVPALVIWYAWPPGTYNHRLRVAYQAAIYFWSNVCARERAAEACTNARAGPAGESAGSRLVGRGVPPGNPVHPPAGAHSRIVLSSHSTRSPPLSTATSRCAGLVARNGENSRVNPSVTGRPPDSGKESIHWPSAASEAEPCSSAQAISPWPSGHQPATRSAAWLELRRTTGVPPDAGMVSSLLP